MELWKDNCLHLPSEFWNLYRQELARRNLLNEAIAGSTDGGIYGGATQAETEKHFTHRFPNSGGRVEVAILDPKKDLANISVELQATFSGGRIKLLDVPCGAGAGTLALLSTLHVLRQNKALPTLPLDVEIIAADISTHALVTMGIRLPISTSNSTR